MRRRAASRARRRPPSAAVLTAALVAVALAADVAGVLARPEQDSVALRFQLRGEQPVRDVAVLAIDDVTFSDLGRGWPFPRSLHGRAVDALRKAGARLIVYDVQFTERTRRREDLALYDALGRAPGSVLATTETDGSGGTDVLGGNDNLKAIGALPAAANLTTEAGGVIQRFPHSVGGLPTLGVTAARADGGRALAPAAFPAGGAWIDFRGPPGTIPTVSFSELLAGDADAGGLRERIVVVGATAPTLQDVHPTPTSSDRLNVRPGGAGQRDLDRAALAAAAQRTGLDRLARDPGRGPRAGPRHGLGPRRQRGAGGAAARAAVADRRPGRVRRGPDPAG